MRQTIRTRKGAGAGTHILMLALFALVLAGSAGSASAATAPTTNTLWTYFGTPHGDSYSSVFLNQLFGDLFPSAISGTVVGIFPSLITYFNVVVLLIGSLMFFWNVSIGILQSAHEGQVLGQRWSSLWAPLRLIFAVGMLVPMANGYNLAQNGVAYVVKGSTRMASAVWSAAANQIISGEAPITGSQASLPPDFIKNMYLSAACVKAHNGDSTASQKVEIFVSSGGRSFFGGRKNAGLLTLDQSVGQTAGVTDMLSRALPEKVVFTTGRQGPNGIVDQGICGSFSTPAIPVNISRKLTGAGGITVGSNEYTQAAQLKASFVEGHAKIIEETHLAMSSAATKAYQSVNNLETAEPADISLDIANAHEAANTLLSNLHKELLTTAQSTYPYRQQLIDRITGGTSCVESTASADMSSTAQCYGEGWLGAGAWYVIMARMNNEISSMFYAYPSATAPEYIPTQNEAVKKRQTRRANTNQSAPSADEIEKNLGRMVDAYDRATVSLAALGYQLPTAVIADLGMAGEEEGMLSKALGLAEFRIDFMDGLTSYFNPGAGGQDPMVGLMELGRFFLKIASGIIAAVVASGALDMFGTKTGLIISAAVMALPFFSVFLTAGSTLQFILPMMPFFYWVLAVSGYFLLIFEAIIAVNLWALSHLRMDGEGISGEAGRMGWLMVLSLFMTPTLMVFGFLIGMGIFRVVSDLIGSGMIYVIAGIVGQSTLVFFFGLVAFSVFIATGYVFLLERSFSLISEFPNRVMRWMGSSVEIGGGEDRIRAAGAAAALGVNTIGNGLEKGAGGAYQYDSAGEKIGQTGAAGLVRRGVGAFSRQEVSNGAPDSDGKSSPQSSKKAPPGIS